VPGGSLLGIIVREFHRGQEKVLVGVPGVNIGSKRFFDHPVSALGLAICLGVEGGGEGEVCPEEPEKSTPEVRSESRVAI
jgi:hypothetical protein